MAAFSHFNSPLHRQFAALSELEKAAQWVSFIDAIDAGDMGWHRYYAVLAPIYEAGSSPFDPEPLEPREIDVFSIEGSAYLEALEMQPAA